MGESIKQEDGILAQQQAVRLPRKELRKIAEDRRITSAGSGSRKRLVTHCHHCQANGRERLADFVHLCWSPGTDLGPVGLCWPCYEKAAKALLDMYSRIMTTAAEIDALFSSLPPEEQRTVRPITPPTYSV